jgi:hypothetical protein
VHLIGERERLQQALIDAAERRARHRADDPVGPEPLPSLERAHCSQRLRPEDAVDRDPEGALEARDGGAAIAAPQHGGLLHGAEDGARLWADDSVDDEGCLCLESTDGAQSTRAEDAVGGNSERPLQLGDGRPAIAELESLAVRAARRRGRPGAGTGVSCAR